jgi:transcriptional regulator with XRE-family HTH domain
VVMFLIWRRAKHRPTSRLRQIASALREERNWSQEKLAELAELHRNYVGRVERGERNVGLLNIVEAMRGSSRMS